MTTVNKRNNLPMGMLINGVDAGGLMQCRIAAGYDGIIESAPDGLGLTTVDREAQFIRGSVVTQDFATILDILAGTLANYTFYERKSGVASATGWVKHVLANPVIHRVRLEQAKGSFVTAAFDFECRFASEAATISSTWAMTDSQAAPTFSAPARAGYRVKSTLFGELAIYHVLSFSFDLAMRLVKACNDLDIGYTAVDVNLEAGMTAGGSLAIQDATISSAALLTARLLDLGKADLALTLTSSMGAADKIVTVANVLFTGGDADSNVANDFSGYSMAYRVSNDPAMPLTLDGDNPIIAIEDAEA